MRVPAAGACAATGPEDHCGHHGRFAGVADRHPVRRRHGGHLLPHHLAAHTMPCPSPMPMPLWPWSGRVAPATLMADGRPRALTDMKSVAGATRPDRKDSSDRATETAQLVKVSRPRAGRPQALAIAREFEFPETAQSAQADSQHRPEFSRPKLRTGRLSQPPPSLLARRRRHLLGFPRCRRIGAGGWASPTPSRSPASMPT